MNVIKNCLAGTAAILLPLFMVSTNVAAGAPKCLYISSYHQGYAWSDGVELGLRDTLVGKCQVLQFDMDTKRNKTPEHRTKVTQEALDLIADWKPDIIITSDDIAAKWLIVPHLKNSDLPVVFSGVNWTVEEYGFPFDNVTGIVEVAPIKPMLEEAIKQSGGKRGLYLGALSLTEEKNFLRNEEAAARQHASLGKMLVSTFDEWKTAYKDAHSQYDFIIVGSSSGIDGWDDDRAGKFAVQNAKLLSVTNMQWMMHVSTLGYTKIPSEHGTLAGEAALAILDGVSVSDIPITTNRKWDLWINEALEAAINSEISNSLKRRAKKVASID